MAYLHGNVTSARSFLVATDPFGVTLTLNVEHGFQHEIYIDAKSFTLNGDSITLPSIRPNSYTPSGSVKLTSVKNGNGPINFNGRNVLVEYTLGISNDWDSHSLDPSRSYNDQLFTRYTLSYNGTAVGCWQPQLEGGSYYQTVNYNNRIVYDNPTEKTCYIGGADEDAIAIKFISSYSADAIPFSNAISTSTLFNANNKTSITASLDVIAQLYVTGHNYQTPVQVGARASGTASYHNWGTEGTYDFDTGKNRAPYTELSGSIGTITFTLNAPPTFTTSDLSFTKNYRQSDSGIYRGYSSASVDVSNLSAKYGGDISSVVFKIANKTVSGTSNGTYTINLDGNTQLGTYTPTVTVTDSRGQTKTQSLAAVTILDYSAPVISETSVIRADSTGAPADEDNYALITTKITWLDFLEALKQPTVTYVDQNGNTQTASVTWYTDSALQNQVQSWSNLTSPVTLYGLTGGLNYLYAYPITIKPEDTRSAGNTTTITLPPAFYTLDFKAGGHGIALGAPATEDGLYIAMETTISQGKDLYLELNPNAESGSTDDQIKQVISTKQWTDCYKPGTYDLSVKKLLSKILQSL